LPDFVMPQDSRTIYLSETYYSRGARGTRIDVVTAYDVATLTPQREVTLPNGRLICPGKKYALALSTDGHYLFSANMRPATSVSVVDLIRSAFITEIDTPGCALVLSTGDTSFAAVCSNGALMNVSLAVPGVAHKILTSPFFDPESDPVFDAPAVV